ncbi:MAG: hypothetical protein U0165_17205 [Polyangiaceae bacterium]
MFWERMSAAELTSTIEAALKKNTPYAGNVLGFPGSFLDGEVFPDAGFLSNAPFLRCLRENPNHIGCHTLTAAESAFSGTQAIEVDLIQNLCRANCRCFARRV